MFIIEFTLVSERSFEGSLETRFAQNPSKTFDHAFTVWRQSEAKRFKTKIAACRWLARFGFMRKVHRAICPTGYRPVSKLPGLFTEAFIKPV